MQDRPTLRARSLHIGAGRHRLRDGRTVSTMVAGVAHRGAYRRCVDTTDDQAERVLELRALALTPSEIAAARARPRG